jgi:hypothetical protein
VVDVFMIDGALLGLLWPAKFEKLAGFCIVGLSFTNLVMNAIGGTGAILCIINPNYKGDRFIYWLDFLEGVFSLIAIIAIVLALALPKTSKVLGLVAICAFIAVALCILIDSISTCTPASTGGSYPKAWAWGINGIAVFLILIGLAFGLLRYSYLLKPDFEAKE